jgi:nucleotide-binding universal stress UspA family protein
LEKAMFKNIVVGIDGQTRGRDAIALARSLAWPGAEITFAHVYPPVLSAADIFDGGSVDAANANALLTVVAEQSGISAQVRSTASISICDGLHKLASETDADLLVIGAAHRNRMTRALLGDFTADTLAVSDCTVAIAPEGYAEHPHEIHRVGVAYDGSSPSEAALAVADGLAASIGAELSAFKVVPAPHDGLVPRRQRLEKAVLALKAGREQIEAHEGVEAHVACGDPVEQLSGYSRTVDLLVAGARGAGLLARLTHPSTTEALVDVVGCPLLVVTRGARERDPVGRRAIPVGV